ncbi:MAG: hypothetical protein V8S34_00635 [Lawsonibacter sp.]
MGKLSAGARGCRKKGSAIAAACQLLCWSELVLSDRGGKWSVSEASTLREFLGVRRDLDKLARPATLPRWPRCCRWRGCPARDCCP